MKKVKIVTDSTADLSSEDIRKYDLEVVPLSIHFGEETYIDRVDITPEMFLKKMKEEEELPKSSQPPTGSFLDLYEQLNDDGFEVISIHLTKNLSGTVQTAQTAAEMSAAKVTVIDSFFISRALSFQVIEAAKLAQDGRSVDEIVSTLEEIQKNTRLLVYVDTLENLSKGGRIGKGRALIGSLLNVKPIAALKEGEYTPIRKVRNQTQAAKFLAKHIAEDVKGKMIKGMEIAHAEGMELAQRLKDAVKERTGYDGINITYTTPIISTHTGPGAIGIMYYFE